jgi:hypothetical protein
MPILAKMKLSDRTRSQMMTSPQEKRRAKLLDAIDLQIKAAEADAEGEMFTYTTSRYVTNEVSGEREKKDVPAKVRPWWWRDVSGTFFLHVKYGNRKLELAKGKTAIEIGATENLVPTLNQLCEAVKAGELDTAAASAAKFGTQ